MQNRLSVIVFLLILAGLACNALQPTTEETPIIMCTPPLCAEGEVYYCEGECPGGCGTQCATPTPEGPTVTSSPVPPTDTPMIMCTPPLCATNEVYYCEGECPGGCGTQCATPTAVSPGLPTILSFTADPMTIIEGENVTLSWQATGGTEAVIQWVTSEATLVSAPGPLDPDGGTVTIAPDGDGDIALIVRNSVGPVETHLQLTIECAYDWAPALDGPPPLASGCPMETIFTYAAQQSFENGFMIWLEADHSIYVFFDAEESSYPTYEIYIDTFEESDPESDPTITPPPGLYQPVRGFGLIWRLDPSIRDGLGWATAPEAGFKTWTQSYRGVGAHAFYTLINGIHGDIYHLTATGSVWEVYSP